MKTRDRFARPVAPAAALAFLLCAWPRPAAAEGPIEPPIPRPLTIEDYRAQVDAALPAFTAQILTPPAGPDWLAAVTVSTVATAVNDLPAPSQVTTSGPRTEARDLAGTKVVKIDRSRGRIRYSSVLRRFDWDTSPKVAVSDSMALSLLTSTLNTLGIPALERGASDLATVAGRSGGPAGLQPAYERERLATLDRIVNGLDVFGSRVRLTVSNASQQARLTVVWPRFQLAPGLTLRTRQAVVEEIAQRLWDADFGAVIELGVHLGYAPEGANFIPVAVAALSDDLAGQMILVPLVNLAPDGDLDGDPDAADNCPTVANPGQEDRDGDGAGDVCDNCPAIANAGQQDGDGNGLGDACDTVPGACCDIPGADCETLPPSECGLVGGISLGNGTTCFGDPDGDQVSSSCDNCPTVANPGQEDADGDGAGNACDCAPTAAGAWAIPAEVTGVAFSATGSTLLWDSAAPGAGSATVHDVVRGNVGQFPVGSGPSACVGSDLAQSSFFDAPTPMARAGFWYLVRGQNVCGAGTYGSSSSGAPRVSTACP